jgi:signal transduction histidine kinase
MTEQDNETSSSNTEKTRSPHEECEARLNEIIEFIGRVRHEINNPLAGVLGQAQLLLREELNDKARKRAETIEQLALRLGEIVAQLRQIQKPLATSNQNETGSG